MKRLLLIDSHSMIHRMYHALPPLTNKKGEATGALYGLAGALLKILKENEPDYVMAGFDRPEETQRKKVYSDYKAHRPKAADDLVEQMIRARDLFRALGIKTFAVPGYEADDIIATAVKDFKGEVEITILTEDMDMTQLIDDDNEVSMKREVGGTKIYDEEAVRARFGVGPELVADYKGLVGDASDNIKGVAGVGAKTAESLLQEFGEIEEIYKKIKPDDKRWKKLDGQQKQALESRELARPNYEVPVDFGGLENLKVNRSDERAVKFFEEMGFDTLIKRLGVEMDRDFRKIEEETKNKEEGEKIKSEAVFVLEGKILPTEVGRGKEEFKNNKLKIGFGLKKKAKESNLEGPYFDLGVGFWLLDPDVNNYEPEYAIARFMEKDWQNEEGDMVEVYRWVKEELDKNHLDKVFNKIEMPLLPILLEMEERGVKIDGGKIEKLRKKTEAEVGRIAEEIFALVGEEFNLNSPKQLGEVLFEKLKISIKGIKKTAGGSISTNYENLNKIRGEHKAVDLILKYREYFKILSTYIEPIGKMVDEDGRLHTTYIQTGTGTGRLSSEQPNLQNIPQGSELAKPLREAFIPMEGFEFLSFDYSQMELRILASVTQDEKMIEAFRAGRDIHTETAMNVFNTEEVTKEQRRMAKVLNFGIVYGMGARAYAQSAGIEVVEAKKIIEEYFYDFESIKKWQENTVREAETLGYVQTLSGRRRLIPNIKSKSPMFLSGAKRVAINMPIQGLGADIMKLAMIAVDKEIRRQGWRDKVRLLLTVHDDLLLEVDKKIINKVEEAIKEKMEGVFKLSVPLKVEAKKGKSWGEMR